jgi:glycine cleavage system pyridoxal-binding protein P
VSATSIHHLSLLSIVVTIIITIIYFTNNITFIITIIIIIILISEGVTTATIQSRCISNNVNVRVIDDVTVGVSFGEAITKEDTLNLLHAFGEKI